MPKPIREVETIRPRVRSELVERLRKVKRPPGIETDENIIDWALHTFCEEHAPAKPKARSS